MKKIKSLSFITVAVTVLLALSISSCGSEEVPVEVEEKSTGHKLSQESLDRIVPDTLDDLNIVMGVERDTEPLATAMSGKALEDMKKTIETDLAQGKVKKREYRNVSAKFAEYNAPFAEVVIELDDFGYFVDANTGAQLTQPTGAHMKYAAALVEEDGRWKIQGTFNPSTPDTPRELPEEQLGS